MGQAGTSCVTPLGCRAPDCLNFIDPNSACSSALQPSTVEELASAEKASRKVAQLRAEEEERLRRECTFQPNTAKPRVKGYGDEYEAPQPRAKLAIAGQASDLGGCRGAAGACRAAAWRRQLGGTEKGCSRRPILKGPMPTTLKLAANAAWIAT